uniref:ATPase dynein-related AAA domain-containing protein n=1 Tax=Plectus sambesii TaxID=2011161 RepID=A0A914XQV0_9BILA
MKRLLSESPSGSPGDKTTNRLEIGGVSVDVGKPKRPELVPCGYAHENPPQSTLHHLKWLLQKDLLKQDVFLIGVPGSVRRNLVMQYLEMSNREYEYLSLTRDTTEADIKQRREIRGGTAYYVDLCAVRAALNGRVLILDGVEKAERNVLPILNNLLENREMQLDDGRFLVAPEKYDKLLKEHTSEELESWQLVRVSKDFHVVALGLPVPKFRGHTLDPPLRSRFQSRHVTSVVSCGRAKVTGSALLVQYRVDQKKVPH